MTITEHVLVDYIVDARKRMSDDKILLFLTKQKDINVTGISLRDMFRHADRQASRVR